MNALQRAEADPLNGRPFLHIGHELHFEQDAPFWRAAAARERAKWRVVHAASRIADAVEGGYSDNSFLGHLDPVGTYTKAKAGKAYADAVYADAVYETEAAQVRR